MSGAGGIGGILAITQGQQTGYPFADGNGNISHIHSPTDEVLASYQYDPYGNKLTQSGPWQDQPYQWSSKEHHLASGLVYYLFRYYSPETGRWPNRDPIEEEGGLNLYGFVRNNPVLFQDPFGHAIGAPVAGVIVGLAGFYAVEVARTKIEGRNQILADHVKRVGSIMGRTRLARAWKYERLFTKLSATAGRLTAISVNPVISMGHPGIYYKGLDWLALKNHLTDHIADNGVLLHELVHAYNYQNKTGVSNSADEGMAYAVQWLAFIDQYGRSLDTEIDGKARRVVLEDYWQAIWMQFSVGKYYGVQGMKHSLFSNQDIDLLNTHLGRQLSCKILAKYLNSVLKKKGAKCAFTCDQMAKDPDTDIPVGDAYPDLPAKLLQ
jgi:RHS repeat-associated protein